MYRPKDHGCIEVVCGPMYSGKSEELIRRIRRAEIAKQKVQVFKPTIDDRYDKQDIGIPISRSEEILNYLDDDTEVIGIDEVQFFDDGIIKVVNKLADENKRVIVAGLDTDFRGEPFNVMPQLMAIAEFVDKITAICMKCGNPATKTQRLIDGKPADYNDPIVLIGAKESYEARCRNCHEVPNKRR